MKKSYLLLVPFLLLSFIFRGQYNNKYFTLDDGLSQVITNDLLLDRDGFVWVATQDGLNRFDGQEFKIYTSSKKDTTSLPGNLVYRLHEDSKGRIWIGTFGKGLCVYDKEQDSFQRIKLTHSNNKSEIITGIAEDSKGNIWVSSRISGLHRFEITENNDFLQSNYLASKELNTLFVDLKGNIWSGDIYGHLYQIDPFDEISYESEPLLSIEKQVLSFFDNGKNLFIGANGGLLIYNYQTRETTDILLGKDQFSPVRIVSSFSKKGKSAIWIGTDVGLFLFDTERFAVLDVIEDSEDE